MKREEMVNKIVEILEAMKDNFSDVERADVILGTMEDEGMSPPEGDFIFEREVGENENRVPY